MSYIDWTMEGAELINCNCDWGCPCQFNRPPSHGGCRAYGFVQIERGHFGDIKLDGLRWGALVAWPAAIHQGNGTFQAIIDERADPAQRSALEAVAHGRETEPGKLIWQVFSTTVTTFLPTLVKPIDMDIDIEARQGRVRVPDVVQGTIAPIRNPVTGEPHRVRVQLPFGFEFTEAELASGSGSAAGPIELNLQETHAHLARIHWSTQGVVR